MTGPETTPRGIVAYGAYVPFYRLAKSDIAATLGLSGRTVENHLRSARRHLGVATTAQAIKIAIRKGEIKG